MKNDGVYVFDEAIANRLRNFVYNLQAAIDELLWRTRVEPMDDADVGFEEMGFREAHQSLSQSIVRYPMSGMDEKP